MSFILYLIHVIPLLPTVPTHVNPLTMSRAPRTGDGKYAARAGREVGRKPDSPVCAGGKFFYLVQCRVTLRFRCLLCCVFVLYCAECVVLPFFSVFISVSLSASPPSRNEWVLQRDQPIFLFPIPPALATTIPRARIHRFNLGSTRRINYS